jgi:hypothetical protein
MLCGIHDSNQYTQVILCYLLKEHLNKAARREAMLNVTKRAFLHLGLSGFLSMPVANSPSPLSEYHSDAGAPDGSNLFLLIKTLET